MEISVYEILKIRTHVLYLDFFAPKLKKEILLYNKNYSNSGTYKESDISSLDLSSNLLISLKKILKDVPKNKSTINKNEIIALLSSINTNFSKIKNDNNYRISIDKDAYELFLKLKIDVFNSEHAAKISNLLNERRSIYKKICIYEGVMHILIEELDKIVPFITYVEQDTFFIKQITFPPEYYLSGMSILSYFGTIIRKKYSQENIHVRIEQNDLNIKMIIESPQGIKEEVEQTLEHYGMIIRGEMSPESIFENKADVIELKQQLNIAKIQLETQRELLLLKNNELTRMDNRIEFVESQYCQMANLLACSLKSNTDIVDKLHEMSNNYKDKNNEIIHNSLKTIIETIKQDKQIVGNKSLEKAITDINREDPSIIDRINDIIIKGSISGAAGNALYSWLVGFIASLPK